jgi:hypothetical protein
MLNEMLIMIFKESNKSQCPLDKFITETLIIGFRQEVIAFATTQTWGLRNSLL